MPWGVAAAAIGAYGASQSGKGGSVQTSQDTNPWERQVPYLTNLYQIGQSLYGKGLQYYPGQTVASQSPQTLEALNRQSERALSGNSLTERGQQEFGKTIAGDYLKPESNPYLQSALNNAYNDVQSRVAGTFGTKGGNNYGSSAHQEWLGRSLTEAASPILNQNYQTERTRQLNAAQIAPSMAYADVAPLAQAGSQQDAYSQSLIDAAKAKYDYNQNAPWDALAKYQGAITGNYGGSSTTNQPYFPANPYLNALGAGIGGVGLYNQGKQAGLWGQPTTSQQSLAGYTGNAGYDYTDSSYGNQTGYY